MSITSDILNFVFSLESGGDFNKWNSQTKFLPSKPLTEMTVGEVMRVQESNFGNNGGAAGAGQIKHGTFETLINNKVLSESDVFDEATQRRAHEFLLNRRGLDKYRMGDISAEEFGNRLAKEYASFPVLTGEDRGKSYYAGKADNKARTTPETVLDVLVPTNPYGVGGGFDKVLDTGIASVLDDEDKERNRRLRSLAMGYDMLSREVEPMPFSNLGLYKNVRAKDPLSRFGVGSLGKEFM